MAAGPVGWACWRMLSAGCTDSAQCHTSPLLALANAYTIQATSSVLWWLMKLAIPVLPSGWIVLQTHHRRAPCRH